MFSLNHIYVLKSSLILWMAKLLWGTHGQCVKTEGMFLGEGEILKKYIYGSVFYGSLSCYKD